MLAVRRFLLQMLGAFEPISPRNWGSAARSLAREHGWRPTMMLWALLGIAGCLNFGVGRGANGRWLQPFNRLAFATWVVVAFIAISLTLMHSFRVLQRLGIAGLLRPRWWFELARVAWSVSTVLLAGLGLSLLLDRALQQMLSPALNWLLQICSVSLPAFFVFSTLGYVVSFATGRPRYGDAYDCVHYYYTLFGSLGTIAAGILLWPPNPGAPAIALSLAIGCAGAIWLGFGFVSIARRLEVWQRRQKRRRVNTANA